MEEERLVKKVYRISKNEYRYHRTKNWCSKMHKILIKYDLEEIWKNEDLIRTSTELPQPKMRTQNN